MKAATGARTLSILALALTAMIAAGCTPEKAKALNIAAVQFRNEALAAIQAVEDMHAKEIAAPKRSDAEASKQFVADVLKWDSAKSGHLSYTQAVGLLDPFSVEVNAKTRREWQAFSEDLRTQYAGFAAIFQSLERGSVLGADAVKKAQPHAESLTAQLAAFASTVNNYPPQLLQQRSALEVEFRKAQQTKSAARIGELRDQLLDLQAAEETLANVTMAQCLKAATLGRELRQLIVDYEKLSLDDLNFFIAKALSVAGEVNGKDYGALKTKADVLVQDMKADPVWQSVINSGLEKVNAAAAARRNR